MKEFKFTINGNKYNTEIDSNDGKMYDVQVNGTSYKVELEENKTKTIKIIPPKAPSASISSTPIATTKPAAKNQSGKGTKIKAPLPGTVIKILVNVGDTVTAGQDILILEAMKMENSITSHTNGRVISILKNRGDSTLEGEDLIIIGD